MKRRSSLTKFAGWIQSGDLSDIPAARFERVKLHIVDTLGARLAGSRIDEGRAIHRLARSMEDGISAAILAGCAQARCTEIDDIHLTSCTTPGAVIVSTMLALAANGRIRSVGECCAATLAGYEATIRLGVAIDGPAALRTGRWPTHFAAAFGAAATASRVYGLSADQTAGALATALAFGSGPPVSGVASSSSRWMTLGVAAADGELAARAAREGLLGGVAGDQWLKNLAGRLGSRYLFDDVGVKPFPTARQGLAAVQAATELMAAERLAPQEIDELVASLPEPQREIVDRPRMPTSRFASIVSLQYQIALALVAGERSIDVARTPPFASAALRRLMSRIRVRRARDLESRHPRMWPARVEIRARSRRFARLVLHPFGDARRPFTWDQAADKFVTLASPTVGEAVARRVVGEMRAARANTPMPPLWDLG